MGHSRSCPTFPPRPNPPRSIFCVFSLFFSFTNEILIPYSRPRLLRAPLVLRAPPHPLWAAATVQEGSATHAQNCLGRTSESVADWELPGGNVAPGEFKPYSRVLRDAPVRAPLVLRAPPHLGGAHCSGRGALSNRDRE